MKKLILLTSVVFLLPVLSESAGSSVDGKSLFCKNKIDPPEKGREDYIPAMGIEFRRGESRFLKIKGYLVDTGGWGKYVLKTDSIRVRSGIGMGSGVVSRERLDFRYTFGFEKHWFQCSITPIESVRHFLKMIIDEVDFRNNDGMG